MLSLILPCYNEANRIQKAFNAIENWDPEFNFEIIFANDGSTDNTVSIIKGWDYPHKLISLPKNQGKGAAIAAGVKVVEHDFFAHWDSDASIDISSIEVAVDYLNLNNADIAIASRRHPKSVERQPNRVRQLLSWGFSKYTSMLLPLDYTDSQCGLKIYKSEYRNFFNDLTEKRFLFDLEVLIKAHKQGCTITEFPITWEHVDGTTTLSVESLRNALISPWEMRAKVNSWD